METINIFGEKGSHQNEKHEHRVKGRQKQGLDGKISSKKEGTFDGELNSCGREWKL